MGHRAVVNGLRTVAAFAATLVTLCTAGPLGQMSPGIAFAQPHGGVLPAVLPPAPDSGRFAPTIQAPPPQVGTWYPQGHVAGPTPLPTGPAGAIVTSPTQQNRVPGEQPDLRTATSATTLNTDGTWTTKTYGGPINYRDAQGNWQPIDDSVVADTSDVGYALGNRANSWHVHFAAQAGGPRLVDAAYPGADVAETLNGAATVAGTTSGSQITYPGVFPGVDLRYGVGGTSLEESLVLHNGQVPTAYTFAYHVPGVTATQDAAGNIVFTDATSGKPVLIIGGAVMEEADAQGQPLADAATSANVTLTLAGAAPDFTITITPDHGWLGDPARRFPVVVDPTSTFSHSDWYANTTTGNTWGDTMDESDNPTTAYYTQTTDDVGDCTYSSPNVNVLEDSVRRSYLKFAVLPAPAAARVTSATLQLYQNTTWTGGGGNTIDANAVLSPWNETTLDWNNHPTSLALVGTGTTSASTNTWVNIDVTSAAYQWWQGGLTLNGFQLQYADETRPCVWFTADDSSDTAHLPTLTITYTQDLTAPVSGVGIYGTYYDSVSGTTYTNTPTVSLNTSYASDPGAVGEWSSNWATVNGVGTVGSTPAAAWSVDAAGSQLTADTSPCGATACWAQTAFTYDSATIDTMADWPTFTAAFKTDAAANFEFGVVSGSNSNTRFLVAASATGFTTLDYSTSAGAYTTASINIPFSANAWYYGQVTFPLANVAAIRVWPAGGARPGTPSVYQTGIVMDHPRLAFFHNGDNAANLHHAWIGNVAITSGAPSASPVGYGVYSMDFINAGGASYSCPTPAGTTWCVWAQRETGWTLPAGDGAKTVDARYFDNAGNLSATSHNTIVLDTTPPTSSFTTPTADREVRGIVTVSASATDPPASDGTSSGVKSAALYLDGQPVGAPVAGTSNPTFTWDTTNVTPGAHALTLQASDNAGNTATSPAITVVVSNPGQMPYETFASRDLPAGGHAVSVNVGNGDAVYTHQDLDIPGRGPDLALGRTYNALAPVCGNLFGCGWTSDLDEGLVANGDGSVTYRDPDGGIHVFLPNGSGGYLVSPGLYLTLAKNGDGSYTLTDHDQGKTNFNANGYLTSLVDRHGSALSITYNGSNLPATVTDASGRQLTITTGGGHITTIAAPGSLSFSYGYDGSGNLTDFTEPSPDPANLVTHYDYDASHRLTKVTLNEKSGAPADAQTNVATSLTYDSENRLVRLVDPLGYDVGITYTAPTGSSPRQTAVSQLQTNSTTTPATGSSVYETTTYTLTTDGMGAVAQMTDPLGGKTAYQYDGNGNTTSVTDPDGHVSTSTYDANGNALTHVVDPGSGHLALTTTYTYDSANNVLTATDPRGIVTQYTYDSPTAGDATTVVRDYVSGGPSDNQTNVTTTSTYDGYGEVLTETDPLGVVTQYTYDSQGDMTQTIANYKSGAPADSQTNVTTSATYDVLGQRLTATDALGVVTQTTYDIMGNVMQTVANYKSAISGSNVDSSGGTTGNIDTNVTTSYGYDKLGRRVTTTNARGIVSQTTYDADGREIKTAENYVSGGPTDSQTNVATTTAYDATGNATVATDAKGNTTTTTLDADNRPTEIKLQAGGGTTTISDTRTTHDAAGLTLSTQVFDGINNPITTYTYDAANRKATESDPPANPGASDQSGKSNVTTYSYDMDGNIIDTRLTNAALTSPVSDTTAAFDKLNRTTSNTEQANTTAAQTTTYAFDMDGRQTTTTDPANEATTTTYDTLGRTLTVAKPNGNQEAATYDANGQRLTESNCGGTTGQTGVISDTYDPLGQVIQEQRTDCSGVTQTTVTDDRDANGNKTQETTTYAGGATYILSSTYDAVDRLATQSDGTRSYTYDANGNATQMLVLNGSNTAVEADATYDGANRLTGLTDYTGSGRSYLTSDSYTYDGDGNRTQVTEGGTTTNYAYDGANQVTTITDNTPSHTVLASYTYDANHNRTAMTTSAGTTTYAYDAASDTELTSQTDPAGKVTSYTYDTNGNLTRAVYDASGANQVTTYGYDASNRLTSVTKPDGTTVAFAYDADGSRNSKAVTSGGTTSTVKDLYQLGHLAEQTDGTGTMLASFSYDSQGVPTSVQVGSDPATAPRYYYVYNGHGDVVALVDGTGTSVASYDYDAWGAVQIDTDNFANGWRNPYLYDGRDAVRYDTETGLYWMSVRAYEPALGRFLSHDPLGRVPQSGNTQPYVYAGNNPLVRVDPSGARLATDSGAGSRGATGASAPTAVRTGNSAGSSGSREQWQTCLGRPHCVIIMGGVFSTERFYTPGKPGPPSKSWYKTWAGDLAKRLGNVGFIAFAVQDADEGADVLNGQLRKLAHAGYRGHVSVVAHSNGAAALFTYMAGFEWGWYSGGARITSFVAMDAPTSAAGALLIALWVYSYWNPWVTAYAASEYFWQFVWRGAYAVNEFDPVSDVVHGAWDNYEYWRWSWNPVDLHTSLAFYPDPGLFWYIV